MEDKRNKIVGGAVIAEAFHTGHIATRLARTGRKGKPWNQHNANRSTDEFAHSLVCVVPRFVTDILVVEGPKETIWSHGRIPATRILFTGRLIGAPNRTTINLSSPTTREIM